jgi:hypothetical protein
LPSWQKPARKAKSAVSAFFHFQRLTGTEDGGTSVCRGNHEEISGSLDVEVAVQGVEGERRGLQRLGENTWRIDARY